MLPEALFWICTAPPVWVGLPARKLYPNLYPFVIYAQSHACCKGLDKQRDQHAVAITGDTMAGSNVITEWKASEQPDENGEFVHIRGRQAGVLSFLLSLVGIDPKFSLTVDNRSVCFEKGSLNGFVRSIVPLDRVASASIGYAKPWKGCMIAGGVSVALPFVAGSIWIGIIGLIAAFLYYFLHKVLFLAVNDNGGKPYELDFKRSVIEGQNIDEKAAERIVAIIEMLMLGTDSPRSMSPDRKTYASPGEALNHAGEELTAVAERIRLRTDNLSEQARKVGGQVALKVATSYAVARSEPEKDVTAPSSANPAPPVQQALLCPQCSVPYAAEDAFCGSCGHQLS